MLDLRAVVERKLRAGGVTEIEHVDLCTHCRETCSSPIAATTG